MITRVMSAAELSSLPEHGVEAQKIRALLNAYGTRYEFCRFFRQDESGFLSLLDGSAVYCGRGDFSEFSEFLLMNGFSELFCGCEAAEALCLAGEFARTDVNLMRFSVESVPQEVDFSPRLSDVYDVLRTGFSLEFEPWYLDMSHRVRHGVTRFALLDKSCLCIQHDINGEALISQVATRPENRGNGGASKLIKAVCAELFPSEVFVICEDNLRGFYEKIGFKFVEKKSILSRIQ